MGGHRTLRRTGSTDRGVELGLWPAMPIPRHQVAQQRFSVVAGGELVPARSPSGGPSGTRRRWVAPHRNVWPAPARTIWSALSQADLDSDRDVLELLEFGTFPGAFDLLGGFVPADARSRLGAQIGVGVTIEDARWWLKLARAMRAGEILGSSAAYGREGFLAQADDEPLWLFAQGLNRGLQAYAPRLAVAVYLEDLPRDVGVLGVPVVGLFSELCRLIHNDLIRGIRRRNCRACGRSFPVADPRELYCTKKCGWNFQKKAQRARERGAA